MASHMPALTGIAAITVSVGSSLYLNNKLQSLETRVDDDSERLKDVIALLGEDEGKEHVKKLIIDQNTKISHLQDIVSTIENRMNQQEQTIQLLAEYINPELGASIDIKTAHRRIVPRQVRFNDVKQEQV